MVDDFSIVSGAHPLAGGNAPSPEATASSAIGAPLAGLASTVLGGVEGQ